MRSHSSVSWEVSNFRSCGDDRLSVRLGYIFISPQQGPLMTLFSFSHSFRHGKWIIPSFHQRLVCAVLWVMMSYLCWCHTGGLCSLWELLVAILLHFPWFQNTAYIQHDWHLPGSVEAKYRDKYDNKKGQSVTPQHCRGGAWDNLTKGADPGESKPSIHIER